MLIIERGACFYCLGGWKVSGWRQGTCRWWCWCCNINPHVLRPCILHTRYIYIYIRISNILIYVESSPSLKLKHLTTWRPKRKVVFQLPTISFQVFLLLVSGNVNTYPRCSMYGIFTYIYPPKLPQMYVNRPYMDRARLDMWNNGLVSPKIPMFSPWQALEVWTPCTNSPMLVQCVGEPWGNEGSSRPVVLFFFQTWLENLGPLLYMFFLSI